MDDPKHRFKSPPPGEAATLPQSPRRRLSKIVHDHKGNATVQWYDAPNDHQRQVFEIEGARQPAAAGEPKRTPGQRTDLRKLSAWIKMMRSLEEAKKNKRED